MRYVGVDPGAKGGIAVIYPDGFVEAVAVPSEHEVLRDWMADRFLDGRPTTAVIELVTGYIGKKRAGAGGEERDGDPGASMFQFGVSYGALQMALTACYIPYDKAAPRTWQKALGAGARGGRSKAEFKRHLKHLAQHLFPRLKVTLATADALLLAEYCRRTRGGA